MTHRKLGCGGSACAFTPVPEQCGTYGDNYTLLLPKSKKAEQEIHGLNLDKIDSRQEFSIHQTKDCTLNYTDYMKYMHADTSKSKNYKFSEEDTITGNVQLNGGVPLSTLRGEGQPSKEYFEAFIEPLRGIGIMNDNMFFHLDLHDENIVIDKHGHSRIIDFGSAVDGTVNPQKVIKHLKYSFISGPELKAEMETMDAVDFVRKYRLYVDFDAGLIGFFDDMETEYDMTLPQSIKHFVEMVKEQKLDAVQAFPHYIEALQGL